MSIYETTSRFPIHMITHDTSRDKSPLTNWLRSESHDPFTINIAKRTMQSNHNYTIKITTFIFSLIHY